MCDILKIESDCVFMLTKGQLHHSIDIVKKNKMHYVW